MSSMFLCLLHACVCAQWGCGVFGGLLLGWVTVWEAGSVVRCEEG